jgi:hypothetical protein
MPLPGIPWFQLSSLGDQDYDVEVLLIDGITAYRWHHCLSMASLLFVSKFVHSGSTTQTLFTPFVGGDMQSLSCLHPNVNHNLLSGQTSRPSAATPLLPFHLLECHHRKTTTFLFAESVLLS